MVTLSGLWWKDRDMFKSRENLSRSNMTQSVSIIEVFTVATTAVCVVAVLLLLLLIIIILLLLLVVVVVVVVVVVE